MQEAEEQEEQVGEIRGEMGGGLELDEEGEVSAPDGGEELRCRSGWSLWSSGAAGT